MVLGLTQGVFDDRGSYQEALQALGHDMLITKALDVVLRLRSLRVDHGVGAFKLFSNGFPV